MSRPPLSCEVVRASLASYYDADTDRRPIDAHLATCASCRERFESLQRELRDLPCRDLVELANDHLEGSLDTPSTRRVEQHLRLCQGCRAYLDQLRRTIDLLRGLAREDEPHARAALPATVLSAYRRSTTQND